MNNQKVVKSDAHVDQGASGTQLDPSISESERECKQDSFIIQGSKEENETKGNDYEQRIGQLTKSLSEKEKEVTDLKQKLVVHKSLLRQRLKDSNEQETSMLQLERELVIAKEEITLLNERLNSSKKEELKEIISKLEKEMNEKVEHLQWKEARIKHLEEQLSEKERSVFNAEGSDAADKRDRELMIKQMEYLKKESERNIAEATRRIDELEETHKEQLKEIDRLREENTVLKGTVEEQGNMREKLTELEALFDKVAVSHKEEVNHIRRKEETKRVELEEKWRRKFDEESQQRTQSHLKEMNEAMEEVKKKYKDRADRLQAREKELQAQLNRFSQEKGELEAQLKEQEEEIEACVNERLREEVDKHLREAVKVQLTSQKIDEQKKVFAAHVKEKEEKVKTQYEVLLASKERRIKELGAELEQIMEQLQQKKETEHNLREEITNLQLRVDAGDGASADNSLSEEDKMRRELEDQATRVRDLEEMIGTVEKDKREAVAVFEIQMKDKDEEIQKLKRQVQNDAFVSVELRKLLEENEKQLADTKKNIEELEDDLSNKDKDEEIQMLRKLLETTEKDKCKLIGERIQTVSQLLQHLRAHKDTIATLEEELGVKNAEIDIYKQDFDTERKDRENAHSKVAELDVKVMELIAHLGEKETELAEARKECKKLRNKSKELEQGETNKVKEMMEEIQVLTAQVNAYSREVDRQKRLLTQSQEKHKTETVELQEKSKQQVQQLQQKIQGENERLANERQQLDNELARMRQQLADASVSKEELMRAYHQEREELEDQIERIREANKTLVTSLLSKSENVISLQQMLSGFQNSWRLSHKEVSLSRQELGRGGWGVVWVGQLRVAVKKLHEWIASQHNMETFHHEINIMSQLRHPNLLQFIGAVLDHPSGCPMIVTEVMDTSLRKAYENKELTPDPDCRPVILSIMLDAAEGLNYLHCLPDPIIHRDVSSANVLLQSIGPTLY